MNLKDTLNTQCEKQPSKENQLSFIESRMSGNQYKYHEKLSSFFQKSDKFIHLETIDFQNKLIRDQSFSIIINNCHKLPNIQKIDLSNNKITMQKISHKNQNTKFLKLNTINLNKNRITSQGITKFVQLFYKLPKLKQINLSDNKIQDEGLKQFAYNSCHFYCLQSIDLSRNKISDKGIIALIQNNPSFHYLKSLQLSGNEIKDEGFKAIIKNGKLFTSLQIIDLSCNKISKDGLESLEEKDHSFLNLKYFDLSSNKIKDQGISAFAQNGDLFPNLQKILFQDNKITEKGLQALAQNGAKFINLQKINLNNNKIKDQGLTALIQNSDLFPNLKQICLSKNKITDYGLKILTQIQMKFQNSQILFLQNNKISKQGIKFFKTHGQKFLDQHSICLIHNQFIGNPKKTFENKNLLSMMYFTNKVIKNQQQIQNLKKKMKERKQKYRKVKQDEFFNQPVNQNPVSQEITKFSQQKTKQNFHDSHFHYKRNIQVSLNQKGIKIIKPSVVFKNYQNKGNKLQNSYQKFYNANVQETWQKIQELEEESPEISRIVCSQVMSKPVTQEQIKKSLEIHSKIRKKALTDKNSVQMIIFKVFQELQKTGIPVIMSQKSTIQSQITLKNLVGGYMLDVQKVQQKIQNDDPDCPFVFEQLQNPEKFQQFSSWYKQKIAKEIGLDPNGIVIHSVTKGSIKVQWSTNQGSQLNEAGERNPSLKKRLKLHKFFQRFQLSSQDFDKRGNIQFSSTKNCVQFRGGWPYYQPIKCKRYGLNVSGKYDASDRWLQMSGRPGQWAVAFHGVRKPHQKSKTGGKFILNNIMEGLEKKSMLKDDGPNQVYNNTTSINKPGQKVGIGVYCSPHIQVALNYTCRQSEYALIFQCRVNPRQIKVCKNEQNWVINSTKNIRPYGIILIKQQVKRNYPSIQNQFQKKFCYKDYRQNIEKFLDQDQRSTMASAINPNSNSSTNSNTSQSRDQRLRKLIAANMITPSLISRPSLGLSRGKIN